MQFQKGFTLIELVLFVVIMGVVTTGVMSTFIVALESSPEISRITYATELAQQRMEVIIGYVNLHGFSAAATDPCAEGQPLNTTDLCASPDGYAVTSTFTQSFDGDTENYYDVEVTVTYNGETMATLRTLLANYS